VNRLLGGQVDTLSPRDSLAPLGKLGNVYGPGGGFTKSPLAGVMLGGGQLNNVNLVKNDVVDPKGETPDAHDRLVVVLPTASVIAITVAELVQADTPAASGGGTAPVSDPGPSGGGSTGPTGPVFDPGGGSSGESDGGPDGGSF